MDLANWLIFILLGRLVIHIWMTFHLPKWLENEWMNGLHSCDLCSGVWIYSVLSFFLQVDLLDVSGFGHIPLVGAIITGIVTAWFMHIFILGWKAKYSIVVI